MKNITLTFLIVFFTMPILRGQISETNSTLDQKLNAIDQQRDSLLYEKFKLEVDDIITRLNKDYSNLELNSEESIRQLWGIAVELENKLQSKLSIAKPTFSFTPTSPISGSSGIANSDVQLGNRKALNRPRPLHNCEAEGTVVVRIWVDKKGVVQKAEVAVSGTTNSDSCLIESAQGAALKTQFEADPDAPNLQVGFVRFRYINQ